MRPPRLGRGRALSTTRDPWRHVHPYGGFCRAIFGQTDRRVKVEAAPSTSGPLTGVRHDRPAARLPTVRRDSGRDGDGPDPCVARGHVE